MLKPQTRHHFDFSAIDTIFVREAFAREESGTWRVYAGVQDDGWQVDEAFFSEKKGAFAGLEIYPPRIVAAQLFLQTASVESVAMDARGDYNFDPLLRVASGIALVAQATLSYTNGNDYQTRKPSEWRLYDAATGALINQSDGSGILGVVADGSYILWARCFKEPRGVADVAGWGEWSATKVVVGAGGFVWNNGVYPGPGSPLYSKIGNGEAVIDESNQEDFVYAFDPLARIVSASCVTRTDIRTSNGQMDIPAGSLLVAGVRASRGGPQTAVWLLRENRTARLICADTTYSDAKCECSKTNHFASDMIQGNDGRLYVLSECDLAVYDQNQSDVFKRLRPFPAETYGHPGGQSLRFARDGLSFWTENLAERQVVTNDGRNFYNQQVYRAGVTNYGGIGSRWHGTNCAEVFRGKLFSVRQDKAETDETATQTLDSITTGRWNRDSIISQSGYDRTWQRVRRCGADMYVFGYKTIGEVDLPTLHIAHENSFEAAEFGYFIRRATGAFHDDGTHRLLVASRPSGEGIGIATGVIEFIDITSRVCAFWNETLGGFVFDGSQYETLGGDLDKLPAFLKWKPQTGSDAGGVWIGVSVISSEGDYLTLSMDADEIRYLGTLPYDSSFWGVLCIIIDSEGRVTFEIEPTCENAGCVFDLLPSGTKWRHQRLETPSALDPIWSVQISDLNEDKRLQIERDNIPLVWLRVDSDAPFEDLTSYTKSVHFCREIFLDEPATASVDMIVIYSAELLPSQGPGMVRRS